MEISQFLKECEAFFVLSMNGDFPSGRPFGAVMEYDGDLYISTDNRKNVYNQLKNHPQMQIVALKQGSRDWIRINGIASECIDFIIKKKMLMECPNLKKHYNAENDIHFALFQIKIVDVNFY